MTIKLTTTTWECGEKKKEKKIQRNLQNRSKHKYNTCFSWVTAIRVLSLTGSQSPLHIPMMLSNTVLIYGPSVGAAQILIWSYFCVFLLPMATAIRTSVLSFGGALNDLLYIPKTQNLPSWSCGFNLQLIQLVETFWSSSLATLTWVSVMVLFPPLHVGRSLGFALEAALKDVSLPLWRPSVKGVQLLGLHGFWQHQVLRGVRS